MILNNCIILNGPPGVGKDTLADIFKLFGYSKQMFKEQLYIRAAELYNIDVEKLIELATNRELKEAPTKLLVRNSIMVSPREALITTSEEVIKPNEGSDYFGVAAAERCLAGMHENVIFSDGGFKEELPPILSLFKDVYLIRLHRTGYDFSNDSRDYLYGYGKEFDVTLIEDKPHRAISQIVRIASGLPQIQE